MKNFVEKLVVKADKQDVNDQLTSLYEYTVWIVFPQAFIEMYEVLDRFKVITDPNSKEETNCHASIIGFMRALVDAPELLLNHL